MPNNLRSLQNRVNQHIVRYTKNYPLKKNSTCCGLFSTVDAQSPQNQPWQDLQQSLTKQVAKEGLCMGHTNCWATSILLQHSQQTCSSEEKTQEQQFDYEGLTNYFSLQAGLNLSALYNFDEKQNQLAKQYVLAIALGQDFRHIGRHDLPQTKYIEALETLDSSFQNQLDERYSIALLFKLKDIEEILNTQLTPKTFAFIRTINHEMGIYYHDQNDVQCLDSNDERVRKFVTVQAASRYMTGRIKENTLNTLGKSKDEGDDEQVAKLTACRITIIQHKQAAATLTDDVSSPRRKIAALSTLHAYLKKGYGNHVNNTGEFNVLMLLIRNNNLELLSYALKTIESDDDTAESKEEAAFAVKINHTVNNGLTALMVAVGNNNPEAVQELLRRKDLKVKSENTDKKTALDMAVSMEIVNLDVLKTLLQHPGWEKSDIKNALNCAKSHAPGLGSVATQSDTDKYFSYQTAIETLTQAVKNYEQKHEAINTAYQANLYKPNELIPLDIPIDEQSFLEDLTSAEVSRVSNDNDDEKTSEPGPAP